MGILTICDEFRELQARIEVAETQLELKLDDWGVSAPNMIDAVEQLPF